MNNINYFKILKSQYKLVMVVVAVVVLIGLMITVFQPFKYRSSVQVLVIEQGEGIDAYTAIRSAERINKNLSYIIYTGSFRDKVLASEGNVFPTDPIKRQQAWEQAVKVATVADTGILKVDVYHRDRDEAAKLAKNIASVLSTSSNEYIGSNQVLVKTVDQAVTSNYPVKPNVALNLISSVALGLLLALGYALLSYKEETEEEMKDRLDSELETLEEVEIEEIEQPDQIIVEPGIVIAEKEEQIAEIPIQNQDKLEAVPVNVEVKGTEGIYGAEAKEESSGQEEFYKMLFPEKN